jgi:hypothetical protein
MNVETGAEAALFPEKEYISGILQFYITINILQGGTINPEF